MPALLRHTLFELVGRIGDASTVAEAWDAYMSSARRVGLTCGVACSISADKGIGETVLASSCPPGWMQNYVEQSYQLVDPRVPMAAEAVTAFTWRLSDWDGLLKGKQLAWRNENEAAGFYSGLVVPDRRDGHLKVIALCGNPGTIHPDDQKVLYYAGLETLDRMLALGMGADCDAPVALSARERECLQWVAAGKSDWEIGTILSISEKTVATHVDRVKHKLKVTTRAQAIVAALRRGLIS